MPSSVLRVQVTQWTAGIKPTWTISEVRSALRCHAEGDFSLSAQLVDSMGEDDLWSGLLDKRVDALLGSDFSLDAVESPNRQQSKRLVKEWGPLWWDMFPEAELGALLRWYLMLGVGVAVIDWERGATRWSPTLRTLHPQFLRYDAFHRRWLYSAREGELEVTPGEGTWVLIRQGNERSWMRGLVRPTATPWITKQLCLRDWGRYDERHGFPIVKAMVPAAAGDGDKEDFFEDAKTLNTEAVALVPTHLDENGAGFDLDLLEATDKSWETFKAHVERCDRRFMVLALGSNLATEITGEGSRAAAATHRGVEQSKAKADGQRLSTDLRRQALFPAIAFNTPGISNEVIPWPKWDTEPAVDTKAEAEDQEKFGQAIKALQDAGFDVENLDELAERHGLKLVKREPPAAPPGMPALPPADSKDPEVDPEARRGGARRLIVASGLAGAEGFIEGQAFCDGLVARATERGVTLVAPTVEAIREELDAATDFDDLMARLRARYQEFDAEDLSELVYRCMVLSELAGVAAVNQDA